MNCGSPALRRFFGESGYHAMITARLLLCRMQCFNRHQRMQGLRFCTRQIRTESLSSHTPFSSLTGLFPKRRSKMSGNSKPDLVTPLIDALSAPSLEVRSVAVQGLARLGDARALKPIMESIRGLAGEDDISQYVSDVMKALTYF